MSIVIKVMSGTVAAIVGLVLLLTVMEPSEAEAQTIKHRSWKGYTTCHSKRYMRHHRHAKRCHRHRSHQYRKRLAAIRYAKHQIGEPYRWGATGPYGFDCSGLIYAAYRHVGKRIPRTTYSQLSNMRWHHRRRIGDLVFSGRHHVALYIGHGRVIEAAHTGTRIRYAGSWRFHYARRSPW